MKRIVSILAVIIIAALLIVPLGVVGAQEETPGGTVPDQEVDYYVPPPLVGELSADGKTIEHGVPAKIVIADPDKLVDKVYIPAPPVVLGEKSLSTINISYYSAGEKDPWGETCYTFPSYAKGSFEAAANIWENTVASSVPISIKACWATLSGGKLGYSGGGPIHRDFSGAPRAHTWYMGSLANKLRGNDMSSHSDMYITYNRTYNWYYGVDGNTPTTKYDFLSVVLHEIGHGLNFAGSMDYSGGKGYYGYGKSPVHPNIYDVYMKNGAGTYLTSLGNGTTALGNALKSGAVYFHGSNAVSINGGKVKMYAPSTWDEGSSYSHLDNTTFNGTVNQLMVYALSMGEAVHDPGPVVRGLLKDLGWTVVSSSSGWSTSFTSTSGWAAVDGTWSASGGYYRSPGTSGKFASAVHTGNYNKMTYQARMKRYGCTSCVNFLEIRGITSPRKSDKTWFSGYRFQYTNSGKYAVLMDSNGGYYTIKGFTASSAILKNGWNTLKVVADGTSFKFYINSTLVWSGTDMRYSIGRVGLGMYRDTTSTGNYLYVSSASLSTATSSSEAGPIEAEETIPMKTDDPGGMAQ